MSTKWRAETFARLGKMGFTDQEAAQLVRASATLHTWAEHECNGTIQRDETTDLPYAYNVDTGKRIGLATDREKNALERVRKIVERHGMRAYHQTDPRGCALYVYRPEDLERQRQLWRHDGPLDIRSCYNTVGVAVVP